MGGANFVLICIFQSTAQRTLHVTGKDSLTKTVNAFVPTEPIPAQKLETIGTTKTVSC